MQTTASERSEPVHQVASRLRSYEDFNLAARLQDEEFGRHYALNRLERRRMGTDVRQSLREQAIEDRIAAEYRAQQNNSIVETDEAIARRLQLEFEREEALKRESQARLDAELARRLQLDEETQQEKEARERLKAEDERLARQLQQQFDGIQRRSGARSIESSAKKVLPLLASVAPKIRLGGWGSPKRRGNSDRNASMDPQWCDRIDERSQNELNQQMATASGIVVEPDAPSPPHISSRPTVQARSRTPLATLATRDTRIPSSSIQKPPLALNSQRARLDDAQQRTSCAHAPYLCTQCEAKDVGPSPHSDIRGVPVFTTPPAVPDGTPSVSDADLIQLSVPASSAALATHGRQVAERAGGGERSSAFTSDGIFGGTHGPPTASQTAVVRLPMRGFLGSERTTDMGGAASGETGRAEATDYRQMPACRPHVSLTSEEVPPPLLSTGAAASLVSHIQTTASIRRLPEPLIPERVGDAPLSVAPLAQPKPAVGGSVKDVVHLLESRCSDRENTASSLSVQPVSVLRLPHDSHVCEANAPAEFTSRLGRLPFLQTGAQSVSTNAPVSIAYTPQSPPESLSSSVQLLQTKSPPILSAVMLHPTNPFLNDIQSFATLTSYGNAPTPNEAVVIDRPANEALQFIETPAPTSSDAWRPQQQSVDALGLGRAEMIQPGIYSRK